MARHSRPGRPAVRPRLAPRGRARGFTYLGILLAVAFLGIALAAAGTVWATASQRAREAELLFVGKAYRDAIGSYYLHSPGGARLPMTLDELVEDNRLPVVQRHLRRLYADPMTGQADWELIRNVDGAITGVRSSSHRTPIKRASFDPAESSFAGAECYCDWQFVFRPGLLARPASAG